MSTVDAVTPVEGSNPETVDIKEVVVQIKPVTPELTPATTPEEQSPSTHNMAGKKVFGLERPDDKARALAAKLTLEEQVRNICSLCLVMFKACYSMMLKPTLLEWLR